MGNILMQNLTGLILTLASDIPMSLTMEYWFASVCFHSLGLYEEGSSRSPSSPIAFIDEKSPYWATANAGHAKTEKTPKLDKLH